MNLLIDLKITALFACLISHTFSINEQCFSLAINQRTILSAMAFQPSEQGECLATGVRPIWTPRASLCLVASIHATRSCLRRTPHPRPLLPPIARPARCAPGPRRFDPCVMRPTRHGHPSPRHHPMRAAFALLISCSLSHVR
jgi:hypothetical protein